MDLLQLLETRYDSVSLSVRCLVSLRYGERLISSVKIYVAVPPSHRKFLFVTPLKSNITKYEYMALKKLKDRKDVMVLKADKGMPWLS